MSDPANLAMPLAEYFETVYVARLQRPSSKEKYRRAIALFGEWIGRPPAVCDVTPAQAAKFHLDAAKEYDWSAVTAERVSTYLVAVARAAGVHHPSVRLRTPKPPKPPKPKRPPKIKKRRVDRRTKKTFRSIVRAARLHVAGKTLKAAARELQVSHHSLYHAVETHRHRWERALSFYRRRQQLVTEQLTPHRRWQVELTVALRRSGATWRRVAETLDEALATIRLWPTQFPKTWMTASRKATEQQPLPFARVLLANEPAVEVLAIETEPATDGDQAVLRFFERVYRPQRLAARSEYTVSEYRRVIASFAAALGRDPQLSDFTNDQVEDWKQWMIEVRGTSPATFNSSRGHLLALWRFARKMARRRNWTLTLEEPDVDKLPEPKRAPKAYSLEELGRLFAAATLAPWTYDGIPAGLWWPAILRLGYISGLRKRPILLAEWEHFDEARGMLFVPAENQKHNEDQVFELDAETRAAIAKLPSDRGGRIFRFTFDKTTFGRHLRQIACHAKLPDDPHLFHKLRKTCATQIWQASGLAAAQAFLGHSSPQVTLRYCDPRFNEAHLQLARSLPQPAVDVEAATWETFETAPTADPPVDVAEMLQIPQREPCHYRAALSQLDITRQALAIAAGISKAHVSQALAGKVPFTPATDAKLLAGLRQLMTEREVQHA